MSLLLNPTGSTDPVIGNITAARDTKIKRSVGQSHSLSKDDFIEVPKGTSLPVLSFSPETEKAHRLYCFGVKIGEPGYTNWYIYNPHWNMEEIAHKLPSDRISTVSKVPAAPQGIVKRASHTGYGFYVPGISNKVYTDERIWCDGKATNFTWSEATKGGERVPVHSGITQNIIRAAGHMDEIRELLGNRPIGVTSWYRDPDTNYRIGGASQSQHLEGNAVDFYVDGLSIVDTYYALKDVYQGGGLAAGSGFVHRDLRPYSARWLYRGGPNVELW